ncbi:MAG: hypothetical protein JWN79_2974 [Gemmatimonadetes bacterium]|jgi:hypothetical protein|nr:hypothetical protein [Gemmatimonadota bacterium]
MAVREFTDSRGVEWRVWDVTPEHMHPITRGEDYMANLQDGWLAFDSGTEKRRLEAPYPAKWITLDLPALEALCARATPVVRRSDTGSHRAIRATETEVKAMESSHAQLTFRSPGGREWTVRVHECLDDAGRQQTVLRFTADDIVVELPRWPSNWQSATMEEFAVMLLDANPPRRRKPGEGPQRRHDDRTIQGGAGGDADSRRMR